MSYILDALKKSDEKRMASLQSKPVQLAEPRRGRHSGTAWFVLLAVVILLAAAWLFSMFQRDQTASAPLQKPSPSPALQTQIPKASPATGFANQARGLSESGKPGNSIAPVNTGMQPVSRPVSQSIPQAASQPTPQASGITATVKSALTTPVATTHTEHSQQPSITGAMPPASAKPPGSQASAPGDSIPLRSELPVNLQQSLPKLRIEGHIYDVSPAARMVIINGHILREGQTLEGGLVLNAITEHGIILDQRGMRFRMGVFDR